MLAGLVDATAGIFHALAATLVAAAAALPSAPPALLDAACDERLVLRQGGAVASAELNEVSGVVESRTRTGVLWVHNDSGDTARIFAIGLNGRTLGIFSLAGVQARDWEDIAAGPGPGGSSLYVGDIGDNDQERQTITVLRLHEPVVDPQAPSPAASTITAVDELTLRYPGGPHNAEALLVDPRSGELVIVTKELDGRALVFRAPAGLADGSETVLRRVALLSLGFGTLVTGADVTKAGSIVALRTYGSVLLYARPAGKPLWAAFRTKPCPALAPPERQGEAIALRIRGRAYVTIGEGEHPRVYRVEIRRR
jgi:hypothetical protein